MPTERLTNNIDRLQNYIRLNASFSNNLGLAAGKSAVPLLFSISDNPVCRDEILFNYLDEIVSQINLFTPLSFGDGIAGIGILLEYLNSHGIMEQDTNMLLEETEPFLLNTNYGAKCANVTIRDGLSGYGIYLISRYFSATPPADFQSMRIKECAIAVVEQLSYYYQLHSFEKSDIFTIWAGLPGICLFLRKIALLEWYEPVSRKLLESISIDLFDSLNSSKFSWMQVQAYFVLLYSCTSDALRGEILKGLNKYLILARQTVSDIDFYEAPNVALYLKLIGKTQGISGALDLSSLIIENVNTILERHDLGYLFPYQDSEQSVMIGLEYGICSITLPLISLHLDKYSWLEIFGITITLNNYNE